MGNQLFNYFSIAIAIGVLVHFILIRVSHKRGLFIDDHESDLPQKLHKTPTPRIGGLGVFLAAILFVIDNKIGVCILGCSIPAFLSGLFEDLFANMSPKKRLLIMVASASMAIYFCGAVVTDFGIFTTPYWLGVVISFIAILGLINGANLIDGFNGLLSGSSLITFISFAYISYKVGDAAMLQINLVLVAAMLSFLVFNYPKGLIFMGDGGAYFIGFIMAVISMLLVKNNPSINPFFVLACIIYPVLEVIFSFVRRGIINKTNPLEPDDKHLHTYVNRALAKGRNPLTTAIILPFCAAINFVACTWFGNIYVLIFACFLFVLIYILAYLSLDKHPNT